MDRTGDYYTKWSNSERERQILYEIPYMWNLKKWYKWIYLQNRNRLTDIENKTYDFQRDKEQDKFGIWN